MKWFPLRSSLHKGLLVLALIVTAAGGARCADTLITLGTTGDSYVQASIIEDTTTMTSFFSVSTTANNPTAPNQTPMPTGIIVFRINGLDVMFGDLNRGTYTLGPVVVGNNLESAFTFTTSPLGLPLPSPITANVVMTAVHDTIRFQITVANPGPTASTVAVDFVQDLNVVPNSTTSDGPISTPTTPVLHTETLLTGSAVPPYWESFFTIAAATQTAAAQVQSIRGTLKPQNNSAQVLDPTPPTRFAYGLVTDLFSAAKPGLAFSFTPNSSIFLDQPIPGAVTSSAVAPIWDATNLTAGATTTVVTYFGQSTTDSDFAPPMSLSVATPTALQYVSGAAQPSPFVINAYVDNLSMLLPSAPSGLNLGPVNLSIALPPGLKLDTTSSSNTAAMSISSLLSGTEQSVAWSVVPDGTVTGPVTVTVTAKGSLGAAKVVQRAFQIPALPSIPLVAGAQMVSFPFNFPGGGDAGTVLGLSASAVVYWNPTTGSYSQVSANSPLKPGFGYWVTAPSAALTPLGGSPSPIVPPAVGSPTPFIVTYPSGVSPWIQIGNPFVYSIPFSEISVLNTTTLETVTADVAADANHQWISPAVYGYDPTQKQYIIEDNLGFPMLPYQGYWMMQNLNTLQFIFPPVATPGASVTRAAAKPSTSVPLGRTTANNWKMHVSARDKTTGDVNVIGVAPAATNGPDTYKYPKPPAYGSHVALDIIHTDWPTSRAATYAEDLRAPGSTSQTWNLRITSPSPNEDVTVTWPDIAANVPRNTHLTLIDTASNTRRDLQSTASYVVNTGKSAQRTLQIVAQPGQTAGRLQIVTFDIIPGAAGAGRAAPTNVTINYAFTGAADAQINIRNAGGRNVRTLDTGTRAVQTGNGSTGTAVWDMRDQRGVALPSGLYSVELVAQTQDGQRSRMVKPYLLAR